MLARYKQAVYIDSAMAAHDLLAARIKAAGLTHTQVAKEMGVTRQAVGGWVRGDRPGRESAAKLDQMLDANGAILDAFGYPSTTRRRVTPEDAVMDDPEFSAEVKQTLLDVIAAFRAGVVRQVDEAS